MKTRGTIIASNLHACQIISGRDVERVAKQIDEPDPTLCTIGSFHVNGVEYVPKSEADALRAQLAELQTRVSRSLSPV